MIRRYHRCILIVSLVVLYASTSTAVAWNSTPRTTEEFFRQVNARMGTTTPSPQPVQPTPQPLTSTVRVQIPGTNRYIIRTAPETPAPGSQVPVPAGLSPEEATMLALVNRARADAGVHPLRVNMALVRVARLKSQDMIDRNYVGHWSPTYGVLRDLMALAGITRYRWASENVAGSRSVEQAQANLMNSDGHRKAILSAVFSEIGIGIVKGGRWGYMVTQLFYAPY